MPLCSRGITNGYAVFSPRTRIECVRGPRCGAFHVNLTRLRPSTVPWPPAAVPEQRTQRPGFRLRRDTSPTMTNESTTPDLVELAQGPFDVWNVGGLE